MGREHPAQGVGGLYRPQGRVLGGGRVPVTEEGVTQMFKAAVQRRKPQNIGGIQSGDHGEQPPIGSRVQDRGGGRDGYWEGTVRPGMGSTLRCRRWMFKLQTVSQKLVGTRIP